jgi:hypothetical protein
MSSEDAVTQRRTVRLVDVPVRLYREAQQHADDLIREVVLMAAYEAGAGAPGAASRLADTANRHRAARHALSIAGERTCAAAGGDRVTIEYDVEVGSAEMSEEWGGMLDELAALCRDGTMLAVPAHDEVMAFARWCCEEFVRQLREGAEPRPWSAYAGV